MSRKKWLILILGFILLSVIVIIGLIFFHPVATSPKLPAAKGELKLEADELEGLSIKVAGTNHSSFWELNFAEFVNRDTEGRFQTVQGRYFQGKRQLYQIRAESGTVSWQERRVRFIGKVHLETEDGKELDADEVICTPEDGKLSARGGVSFRTPDLIYETSRLDSDMNLRQIRSRGSTQVRFLKKRQYSTELHP